VKPIVPTSPSVPSTTIGNLHFDDQLLVAGETQLREDEEQPRVSESTQGEGESDDLHAPSLAPSLQDLYDPMQWGGAAPAAHTSSRGGPPGGGAAEESARLVEPVEVRVHVVRGLTGETIGELKAVDVESLKNSISRITGVFPYQQKLQVEGREYPLWDTEVLADISASHGDGSLAMKITMVVDSEEHARGPYALGQENSWGSWKGMSNSSGPLSGFDGRWKSNDVDEWQAVYHGHRHCWQELEITGTQVLDAFEKPYELVVRDGKVYTISNQIGRRWWMQDDHLFAMDGLGNQVETYSRMATRHPQRISSPTHFFALSQIGDLSRIKKFGDLSQMMAHPELSQIGDLSPMMTTSELSQRMAHGKLMKTNGPDEDELQVSVTSDDDALPIGGCDDCEQANSCKELIEGVPAYHASGS